MKRKLHKAFTLLELIIVIVIMGIAAKFGVELLMRAYEDYIYGVSNNRLLAESEAAVTQIANRLQYRIKESVIYREGTDENVFYNNFDSIATATDTNQSVRIFEWVGYDIDGWHGDGTSTLPTWSGIIDVNNPGANATTLISPESNVTRISNVISALSPHNFSGNGSALFFIGDESVNVRDGFAWDGNVLTTQNANLHPVTLGNGQFIPRFTAAGQNFGGVDVYEYYRLAWTAYDLVFKRWTDNTDPTHPVVRGTLWLYYDYRPWLGDKYNDAGTAKVVLMENVQTLRFSSIGDVLKVQVCVGDGDIFKQGAYSVCKEKTIF